MSINDYFSIEYLVSYGYFDFKPTKVKNNTEILENNKYIDYVTNTNFYRELFNCQGLYENLENIISNINFDSKRDTMPIEFTIYKSDDSRRLCKMPNMYSYLALCLHIDSNKDKYISIINSSKKSLSKTFYDRSYNHNYNIKEQNRFGKRYLFKTDIQEFYSSIYTHSIPWAIIGKENAKNEKRNPKGKNFNGKYYNMLDYLITRCQHGETHGIPTGPFTSRIISEIYLCKLDQKLESYNYKRYVDDFEFAYNNEDEKENFYNTLVNELNKLNLKIKIEKNSKNTFPFELKNNTSNMMYFLNFIDMDNLDDKKQSKFLHTLINMSLNDYYTNKQSCTLKTLFVNIQNLINTEKNKKGKISKDCLIKSTVIYRLFNIVLFNSMLFSYFLDLIKDINDYRIIDKMNRFIEKNKKVLLENIKKNISSKQNHELFAILNILYLLDSSILDDKNILYSIIETMDDFNSILGLQFFSKLNDTIINDNDWKQLFDILEKKLEKSDTLDKEFWLLKYEIYYEIKHIRKSSFSQNYEKYILNKYEIDKQVYLNPEDKKLKSIKSNIILKKNNEDDKDIFDFYKLLLKNKVSFFNRSNKFDFSNNSNE